MARQVDRPEQIDEHFRSTVAGFAGTPAPVSDSAAGPSDQLLALFDAQLGSRHLDFAARDLGRRRLGYYSIGSSGHESNAAVAAGLRPTDPALLHYRSGAFYLRRAAQVPGHEPLSDVLLGVVAAADEPISAGRHKVFGHGALSVLPQTSTIASHLPRAMGLAFSLGRAGQLGTTPEWPGDSVVVCSFGDASLNHSTALGAINSALHCAHRGLPMPLLLVCEDNGIGISVRTPADWVRTAHGDRPGLRYSEVDGSDPASCLRVAAEAADWVREHRRPALLHLRTVRLMGHAGSDVESAYRSRAEILAEQDRDPLLGTAELLVRNGVLSAAQVLQRYEDKRAEVARAAEEALGHPKLADRGAVMAAIHQHDPDAVRRRAERPRRVPPGEANRLGRAEGALTLAESINRALAEALADDPGTVVFGEDVATKGGVYGVTRGLRRRFGGLRVFDTLLDEQSVLGTALGAGTAGLLPVPEIQYLAYLHNAADQLRGEAATQSFFSDGRYRNPMVVRIAGYAYQKGFGGHFHNDNSVAALRDIPGLVVASPSRPDDAVAMLRTCLAAAREEGRVCAFLEPIALYHERDLHEADDGGWLAPYPERGRGHVPIGRARSYGAGADLTIITFGNGLPRCMRVAHRLEREGAGVRVLDLRWLSPLPVEDVLAAARATGAVLVADETRRSGGVSESVLTALVDAGFSGRMGRVTSEDSFIPLGDAAYHVLLSEQTVEDAARKLLAEANGAERR